MPVKKRKPWVARYASHGERATTRARIAEFYRRHSLQETMLEFRVSRTTVFRSSHEFGGR